MKQPNYKALLEESLKFLPSNLRSLLSVLEVYTNEANLSPMNEEQVRDALSVFDACRYSTMALEVFLHKLAVQRMPEVPKKELQVATEGNPFDQMVDFSEKQQDRLEISVSVLRERIKCIKENDPTLADSCEDMESRLLRPSPDIKSVYKWVKLVDLMKIPKQKELLQEISSAKKKNNDE